MKKLVRDNIPKIINDSGRIAVVDQLDNQSHIYYLAKKMEEESLEVLDAVISGSKTEVIEELADLIELIEVLKIKMKISSSEISKKRKDKNNKNGSFNKGYFFKEIK